MLRCTKVALLTQESIRIASTCISHLEVKDAIKAVVMDPTRGTSAALLARHGCYEALTQRERR